MTVRNPIGMKNFIKTIFDALNKITVITVRGTKPIFLRLLFIPHFSGLTKVRYNLLRICFAVFLLSSVPIVSISVIARAKPVAIHSVMLNLFQHLKLLLRTVLRTVPNTRGIPE